MKHLYVMLSHTNTGFGRLIRRVSRCHYNHAAIAFDEDLAQLYSFARKLHDIPLSAGLTRETPAMYAMGQQQVDVIIYRVPVSDQDYTVARRTVQMMCRDGDYIYNVLSARRGCRWISRTAPGTRRILSPCWSSTKFTGATCSPTAVLTTGLSTRNFSGSTASITCFPPAP